MKRMSAKIGNADNLPSLPAIKSDSNYSVIIKKAEW